MGNVLYRLCVNCAIEQLFANCWRANWNAPSSLQTKFSVDISPRTAPTINIHVLRSLTAGRAVVFVAGLPPHLLISPNYTCMYVW